ncbi:MAG TPA: RluA family pseudouridine synthase [Polyangiaceae bacterium]
MSDTAGTIPDLSFVVAEDEAGLRVDRLVVRHAGELGRRGVAELFRRGLVRADGRVAKKGDRATAGRTVSVVRGDATPIRPETEAPLDVRLEREDLVVVRKPAGQPTAPIRLGETGTLAGALLGRYPELLGIGHQSREPGLLHRLDTQTSGLLVAARTVPVFEHLWRGLSEGRLEKRYLAVVESRDLPESGVIESHLAPDPGDPRRVAPVSSMALIGRGRPSSTAWRRVRVSSRFALVDASAPHAYRHQVRVHLASIGHPIAGDTLYGGVPAAEELGARHALHASYVGWAGDEDVPAFAVEDPLPHDLAALLGS